MHLGIFVAVGFVGPAPGGLGGSRAAARMATESPEGRLLQEMAQAFWKSKKDQLRAEVDGRLRELEELQARERAMLSEAAGPLGGVGGSAPQPALVASLEAELEAERRKTAALEAELAQTRLDAELNLQKVAAFWLEKLAVQRELAGSASPAPALGGAAPSAAPPPDLVATPAPLVPESMTLREMRAKLLQQGLSTLGLKSELRQRLEEALRVERNRYRQWDPSKQEWSS